MCSVSSLAHMPGIDRTYFCSIFMHQMGHSPKQYIQSVHSFRI
ncbi:helix-turn-helix transcriptional regulator [uncultured Acetatifactor sp.]|nr:helix-turn-helix transcriptional regulator [uncultured Acetatifactor sp.]